MAILGGSVLPPLQAMIIDQGTVSEVIRKLIDVLHINWVYDMGYQPQTFGDFPATNISFILPFICFLVVYVYGIRTAKR
jgi:FHS family L-fucose permease-like MFS transporter